MTKNEQYWRDVLITISGFKSDKPHKEDLIPYLIEKYSIKNLQELAVIKWVCNECNAPNFTSSVSEQEIAEELHACINCGCFEFHLVNKLK